MIIIALILIGYCLLNVALQALIGAMFESLDTSEVGVTIGFASYVGNQIIAVGSIGTVGLFTAIAIGLFNGADFKNYTIRNKITAGCSRDVIFLSAFVVNQIINLAFFIIASLTTLAFGAMMIEFEFAPTFAADLAMTFLISAAFAAVMTFFSFVTKKTSWTILIGVLIATLAPSIFGITATYYFSFYLNSLMGFDSSYAVLEWISRINLFSMNTFISYIGDGTMEYNFGEIIGFNYNAYVGWLYGNAAITSLIWGGGAAAGGMLLFRKTDIK